MRQVLGRPGQNGPHFSSFLALERPAVLLSRWREDEGTSKPTHVAIPWDMTVL